MVARGTGTANMIVTGDQMREIRQADVDRFKRKVIRKIKAQKHYIEDGMNLEEAGWKTRENDAYDMAIRIIEESTADRLSRS